MTNPTLTSTLSTSLMPQHITQSPLINSLLQLRLDKIEFRGSIQTFGITPYISFKLPHPLPVIFENEIVKVTHAGFLSPTRKSGMYSTNGAIITRTHCGLSSPVKGISRNQLTDDEVLGDVGKVDALSQIQLFLDAQHQLYSFAKNRFIDSYRFKLPLNFQYIEFYVEFLSPVFRDEFYQSCATAISKSFGAAEKIGKDIREINERQSLKHNYINVWEINHAVKQLRDEKIRIKLYDKGSRIRLEVSFRNFRTRTLPNSDETCYLPETITSASKDLILNLHCAGQEIISALIPSISSHTPEKLNAETFRIKLKEYKVRGVKNLAYSHMIKLLDTNGVYDPSTVLHDERPTSAMLGRLSNPDNGILIKKSFLNVSGRPKKNHYYLRDNWQDIHPKIKK